MNRLFKIILLIMALIIGLIVAAVIILPLLVSPNDFKPQIQTAVKDATGRELVIEGDLELSVFPWIGVSTGKITLSNAENFLTPFFAEVEESNVKVKLLPLLSKEIEVSRIVFKGLVLNLAKNKQGVSNWDDLSKKENSDATEIPTDSTGSTKALPLAALAIGGISIEQAKVSWDDQQKGQYTEITDFNFSSGKLAFDQAVKIALSLTINNKEPAITESINFTTDLIFNKKLDIFKLNSFNLESVTEGNDIPGEKLKVNLLADIAIDLTQQILNISELKLSTDEFMLSADIKGTQIIDNPTFEGPIKIAEFNLAKFMQDMSMSLPEMQDASALSKLSASLVLHAASDSAALNHLVVKFDDTTLKGFGQINNFSKPAVKFNINVDSVDADRYLAPIKEGSSSKTIATPASAAAASAGLFPVKTLRELNANGKIQVAKLKVNQLTMKELSFKLKAKQGIINTEQAIKQFYQGRYQGKTSINVQKRIPSIALNEHLLKVDIGSLLNDMQDEAKMSGIVNVDAVLKGYGNSTVAIKSSLNGKVSFNFNNGVIKGFNLQKIIDSAESLINGKALPTGNKNDQTVFSIMKGTANINKGVLNNDDLYMEASKLRVNGKGTVNLASDKLSYKINAKLLKTIGSATEAEKIKGLPVVINVGGTTAKPSYQLDVATMLLEKNSEKINKKKDELLKKLDEEIAPGLGDLIKGFL